MVVAIQLSVLGLYFPPLLKYSGGGPSLSSRPRRSSHFRSILRYDTLGRQAHWSCSLLPNCRVGIVFPTSI